MARAVAITLIPGVLRMYKRRGYTTRWRVGPWWMCTYYGGDRKRVRREPRVRQGRA